MIPMKSFLNFIKTVIIFHFYFHMFRFLVPSKKFTKVVDGLIIKNVTKSDSGEYTCKAFQVSTTISNVKEQTIRLNIQRKYITPSNKTSQRTIVGIPNYENLIESHIRHVCRDRTLCTMYVYVLVPILYNIISIGSSDVHCRACILCYQM